MNIMATFSCPVKSAQYLDDKRLNKMITESIQMLSTAAHHFSVANRYCYKPSHANHPCNVWIRSDKTHYEWLVEHTYAMFFERERRLGRYATNFAVLLLLPHDRVLEKLPCNEDWSSMTFQNCARNKELGIDFTWMRDTHKAYRSYLKARWPNDARAAYCSIPQLAGN